MLMQGLWKNMNNIPYYTNMLEEAQHKAQWGVMSIPDMQIVSIATQVVLADYQLPLHTLVWEGKVPAAKTWNFCKAAYIDSNNQ